MPEESNTNSELKNSLFVTTIPVHDLSRALKFYTEILNFKIEEKNFQGIAKEITLLKHNDGSKIFLYKTKAKRGENTILNIVVKNLEKSMKELESKGIEFQQYECVGTDECGIAKRKGAREAWFKDSEGNLLGINDEIEFS